MSDHPNQIGLGLEMDGSTHFNDLTNLVVSPRRTSASVDQSVEPGLHAREAFAQHHHINVASDATYNAGPQHSYTKHASAGLNVLTDAHLVNGKAPSETVLEQSQQQPSQGLSQPYDANSQSKDSHSAGPAQAFSFDVYPPLTSTPTAAQANPAAHPFFGSPMRCSGSDASTIHAHSGHAESQAQVRSSHDQANDASMQRKLESPFVHERHQIKSYPASPQPPSDLHSSENSGAKSVGGRHVPSHRPSQSLGQAAAFMSNMPAREIFAHNHASAPVSPSDGISAGPFPSLFPYPGPRQDMGPSMIEHGHTFAQGGPHTATRNLGSFATSSVPSARSTSPSASLASTSVTSISPLGSARIHPDGSFTSQETSFDSMSNAASGSFSRASSTSEDVFSYDLGSLGLASSLRMSKQKKKLRNIDRKLICDYSAANPQIKQDAIAHEFGIERSTVSKILKQKEKWLAIDPSSDAARIAKHRAVKFPAVEDRLTSWVAELRARGEAIRDSTIRHEALRIARELGLGEDKFKASGGWIEKFRERNQIPKPQSVDSHIAIADQAGATRESTPAAGSLDLPVALKREAPSDEQLAASNASTAGQSANVNAATQTARRQPARGSKAKATPQKRAREEQEKTQAILGMSPLSQDMARMHFHSGGPPGPMPSPAFFRPELYMGHASMPMPMQNYAMVYQGQGFVPGQHQATDEDAESDRKRRRAIEELQANQASMALGAAIDFQFPPTANPSASAPQVHVSEQLSQALGHGVVTPPKTAGRGRRAASKASASSSRGRSRRGKGRLSNVNHTPQTPSPLSMSPADAGGETSHRGSGAADASPITAASLGQIQALSSTSDASSVVTAGQAQQCCDLVLRFLREQPPNFVPQTHLVVVGDIQANIEQIVRQQSSEELLGDGGSSQQTSALQDSEDTGDAVVPCIEEQRDAASPAPDAPQS